MSHASSAGVHVAARPGSLWFAAGAAVLGLGTCYFLVRGAVVEDRRARRFHAVMALVPGVAFASYLAMLFGFGVAEVTVQGRGSVDVYWARYADWLFTTPLLLVILGLLAGADGETLFGAVAVDAFMIVTGLAATLSRARTYRFVWWGISVFAFLLVAYFLVVTLDDRARRRGPETVRTFRLLRNLTLGLWAAYPVWWLLGGNGAGLVGPGAEALGFAVLDVLAKVGFGILLLHSDAVLEDASAPDAGAPVTADPAE
ncbi:MAG: bacteriorhodopsin [Haloferacaceae archaeon]